MKYLATYLLLKLGGKEHPSKEDIMEALEKVGIDAESEDIDKLLAELEGKDLNEMIAQGNTMLATFGGSDDSGNSNSENFPSEDTGENKPNDGPEDEPPEDGPNIAGGGLFGDPDDGDYWTFLGLRRIKGYTFSWKTGGFCVFLSVDFPNLWILFSPMAKPNVAWAWSLTRMPKAILDMKTMNMI